MSSTSASKNLLDLSSGDIKNIKNFINEIPDSKLIPDGAKGTNYPPAKDQEVGGWRFDEQGFTTFGLANNLQIQLNTKGVCVPMQHFDVEIVVTFLMQGERGTSALMILVSSYGISNGKITEHVIRDAH